MAQCNSHQVTVWNPKNIQNTGERQGGKSTNCDLLMGCWILFRFQWSMATRVHFYSFKLAQVREAMPSPGYRCQILLIFWASTRSWICTWHIQDCSMHNKGPSCNLMSPLGTAWTILRRSFQNFFSPTAELAQPIYHHSHFPPSHHCLSVTIRITALLLDCCLWTKATLKNKKKSQLQTIWSLLSSLANSKQH